MLAEAAPVCWAGPVVAGPVPVGGAALEGRVTVGTVELGNEGIAVVLTPGTTGTVVLPTGTDGIAGGAETLGTTTEGTTTEGTTTEGTTTDGVTTGGTDDALVVCQYNFGA